MLDDRVRQCQVKNLKIREIYLQISDIEVSGAVFLACVLALQLG
jgi:hypothetical protein